MKLDVTTVVAALRALSAEAKEMVEVKSERSAFAPAPPFWQEKVSRETIVGRLDGLADALTILAAQVTINGTD